MRINHAMNKVLSRDEIKAYAPSVFGVEPAKGVTEGYNFFSTEKLFQIYEDAGWVPVRVQEMNTKDETKIGKQKHMIAFRQIENTIPSAIGEEHPEVIVVNSHDRSAALNMHMGIFRMICGNGLVLGDKMMESQRVIHYGQQNTECKVMEATNKVILALPLVGALIDSMKAKEISTEKQKIFAETVMTEKWGEDFPIEYTKVLAARRPQDNGNSLWLVMNRIQENVIKGGLKDMGRVNKKTNKLFNKTKTITNIDENIRLNAFILDTAATLLTA